MVVILEVTISAGVATVAVISEKQRDSNPTRERGRTLHVTANSKRLQTPHPRSRFGLEGENIVLTQNRPCAKYAAP